MTTKPTARKFRIRRSTPIAGELRRGAPDAAAAAQAAGAAPTDAAGAAPADPAATAPPTGAAQPARGAEPSYDLGGPQDDGFGDTPFPTAAADTLTPSEHEGAENEIAQIRREGLTGRQLRMARRVAQKHGLAPTSDFDAVRLLRRQGIDPFQRSNMLELVVSGQGGTQAKAQPGADPEGGLPQTVKPPQLPSTDVRTEEHRTREIMRIQQDIIRRRRRKLLQLVARLAFFVGLPTILAGYYYFKIATPMYATKSEFVIQLAESPMGGGAAGLSGLFSGTGFATSQDSIAVQGYLQSRDAMLRLDTDHGFREHFSNPDIDALQRLETGATNEEAYKVFKKRVKLSYDPTEGIIKMEVVAATAEASAEFSRALIGYAEEQVDNLTQRLREDQMSGARESFEVAEQNVIAAQQRVLALQERLGVLDPMVESNALMSQISSFETQLQEKRLQLQSLLANSRPNQARVQGVEGDIARLEALIAELRAQLTESGVNSASLARMSGELRLAETDLETRQMLLAQALQQMETARIEANRQTRYLSMGVTPIAPDEATYPRAFENTLVALLIFGGIYLMISLTASILREQVSS